MAAKEKASRLQSVGVIGGGAWGTALAQSLRMAGRDVLLWARDPEVVSGINHQHVNEQRLPGIALDHRLRATNAIDEAAACDFLLIAVPSQHVREASKGLKPHWEKGKPLVICAKGFEFGTGLYCAGVVSEVLGGLPAVLSGPSFASDVARGLPTAVTLAAFKHRDAAHLAAAIGHKHFRVYTSQDLAGVQLGGAVKNVLAIAAGILVGRRLGASAHAALVTRAFYELSQFAREFGAQRETLTGLSCLGDLILTCNSPQSRNFTLGRHLGEGRTLPEALAATGGTVEGVVTATVVVEMARKPKRPLEMPIASAVQGVVSGRTSVNDAIDELLSRPQKAES